jgi:hypothetical protein
MGTIVLEFYKTTKGKRKNGGGGGMNNSKQNYGI